MPIKVAATMALIFSIIGTILLLILVVPKNRRKALGRFMKFLHDLFNFKFLIIESILKALYVFSTVFVIVFGFFLLFSGYEFFNEYHSFAGTGIGVMLIGPVVIRIVYEFLMLSILLVKNVIEINNRAKGKSDSPDFGSGGYKIKRPEFVNQFVNRQFTDAGNPAEYHRPVQDSRVPSDMAQSEQRYSAPGNVAEPVAKVPNFAFCTQCGTRYDKNEGGCPKCGR